jgi:hypothetical protein
MAVNLLAAHLMRRDAAAPLNRSSWRLHAALVRDILRVGVPASMSPVVSNASIAVATAFVGSFGTAALAGYGVAARLEYILVPIAFGFGTALTAMVATNMGAGNAKRALRVAWLGAAIVAAITGAIGLTTAIAPALWMNLFTQDAAVREFGGSYLPSSAPSGLYGFATFRLAGRRAHVLAAGRQRGPAGGRGARRLGLRACAADLGKRLLRRGRDQSGPLWPDHRRCDQAGQLDALVARSAQATSMRGNHFCPKFGARFSTNARTASV